MLGFHRNVICLSCAQLRHAPNYVRRVKVAFAYASGSVFLLPDCWFLFYTQSRHRVTRLTFLLADVPMAQTFSYSISYDTCRGHAAFTLFFYCGDLLPGLSGALRLFYPGPLFGRSPGFFGAGKFIALDHARHRVTRLTWPSLTLQALVHFCRRIVLTTVTVNVICIGQCNV